MCIFKCGIYRKPKDCLKVSKKLFNKMNNIIKEMTWLLEVTGLTAEDVLSKFDILGIKFRWHKDNIVLMDENNKIFPLKKENIGINPYMNLAEIIRIINKICYLHTNFAIVFEEVHHKKYLKN